VKKAKCSEVEEIPQLKNSGVKWQSGFAGVQGEGFDGPSLERFAWGSEQSDFGAKVSPREDNCEEVDNLRRQVTELSTLLADKTRCVPRI